MEIVRPTTASAFLELAGPLLERDEARNQLPLGIAAGLIEHAEAYDVVRFWVGVEAGRPFSAALRTEPHNLVLADPEPGIDLEELLVAVANDDPSVPGIVGNEPYVGPAAARIAALAGMLPERDVSMGVFALERVGDVRRAPGQTAVATPEDRDLIRRWFTDFAIESLPDPQLANDRLDRTLDTRFSGDHAGIWLWIIDGAFVSMSGYSGRTPSGIRIGPVYTPPEHRRRGYATTLVADQSRWLLEQGYRSCFLYTDLSNPTSNAIYERIGYERVADSAEYRFVAP
jgi:RimJ/RimL family protein N-acetyltransferase